MTREFRQYLSRIRKAQDAILNRKNNSEKSASLSLEVTHSPNTNDDVINVWGHLSEGVKCLAVKSATIASFNHQIEEQLAEVSKLIGWPI